MNAITPFNDFRSAYASLTPMETKFVDGYVVDLQIYAERTGARLAAVLHLPFPGELDRTAVALLARPMVRAAIVERINGISQEHDLTINRSLRSLGNLAYSNIKDYFDISTISGMPELNLAKASADQLEAVKSIEIEDMARGGRKTKITMHDKTANLLTTLKYFGVLQEDNEHWRQATATEKPDAKQIPADADLAKAADMYARLING